MTESYYKLAQALVSSTPGNVYTVGTGLQAIVKHILIVNTTGSDATVQMWQGGTTDAYMTLPTVTIVAGGFAENDAPFTMEDADYIRVVGGTNNALTITIHGVEVT